MKIEFFSLGRVLACAASLLAVVIVPAIPQPLTSQGVIAFRSTQDWNPALQFSENSEIYVVYPDNKESIRLTNDPEGDGAPSLSADGSRLFFASSRMGKVGIYELELIPKIGPPKSVVSKDDVASIPVPSANGLLLAFVSRNGSESWLNTLDLKTGLRRRIVPLSGTLVELTFVPDNKRIIFASSHPGGGGGRDPKDIWIVDVDGTQKKLIGRGASPDCNPQGTRVVFEQSGSIYTKSLDGSDVRRITPSGSFDANPDYSPDGTHVVFDSNTRLRSARGIFASEALGIKIGRNIYSMRNDGTGIQRMTFGVGDDTQPAWSTKYGVPYTSPPAPLPTPIPRIQPVPQTLQNEPLANRAKALAPSELVYAFNDLKTAPYPSFVGAQTNGKAQNYRLQGPNLQGTDGDFVFDAQLIPGTNNVLLKLGDPAVRERNPYNSYRLWNWNRTTNALTAATPRELFFRHIAPAPDGQRLAYIAGGNALGQTPDENGGIGEPLRLYVYDAQTQIETLVSDNDGVRGGFNWLDADTLLYTKLGKPEKTELNPKGWARPSIYAFDVKSGQSKLVLNEARHPLPSPDGSRFAFWGLREKEMLPLPDDWWQKTGYSYLSVANRDGSERKAYSRLVGAYPSLVWASDSQRMFTVSQRPTSDKETARPITEWNLRLGQARRVGTLQAKDAQETPRDWFQPQFRALGVAPDGKSLFVAVEEVSASGQVTQRVQSVELATGKNTEVAKLRDVAGFDWQAATP